MFSREFQHNIIKCVPLDFFSLRDHRRTSPFSNLFKILLELSCCYFRIALFLNALFFLYFNF